ncbi:CotH kinase family protein [Verrucomicrobiota bacterium sgz303538]
MMYFPHSLLATLAVSCLPLTIAAQVKDAATSATSNEGIAALSTDASDIFSATKIWTIHLTFEPEQWAAMEPKGGPGSPGGPEGQRGPGPGRFGPAMFLAPAFVTAGDTDHDGKLSSTEFQGLAEKWFAACDAEKNGRVDGDKLRTGLNISLTPPPGAMPGPQGRESFLQGAEGKRNGIASAMGIEFKYVHANLEFEGEQFKDVAVRYKGNGTFLESRGALKRSLKIDLNKYVKGQKLGDITTLNLHSNVTDPAGMNEALAYRLYRDAGAPAPHTTYARVYVTVPGKHEKQYLGIYSLVEDINKNFTSEQLGTKKGAIFKPVTPRLFTDLGSDWSKYKQTYDPKDDVSADDAQRVIDFSRLVTNADDAEFAAKAGEFLDLEQFARYMAATVWLTDLDGILGPGQNFYLHLHPKTRKFTFIAWDQDHSFGHFARGTEAQRENMSIHKPWQGENRFLERVFKVEAFKKPYLERLEEFSKTLFRPERFQKQVDEIASIIRPAVQEESAEKLARFDRSVAGEVSAPAQPAGFPGPGFGGPMTDSLKPVKPFVIARTQSVIDQLAGKSEGMMIEGFGPRPNPGPQKPGAFGPGNFIGPVFMTKLDADKDSTLSQQEFVEGFAKWFSGWNTDGSGVLTDEQLRAGIDKDFTFPGRPPGQPPQRN